MKDEPSTEPATRLRDLLATAHADLSAVSKRAIGDDGRILFGAAAALDVAVEAVMPPNVDRVLAAQSCEEALKLVKVTRAHEQRESGGAIAQSLAQATRKIEDALKLIRS
jgi:hypothetical protein